MFRLMLAAYSTISIEDAARFLGMNQGDATNCKISLALVLFVDVSALSHLVGYNALMMMMMISNVCLSVII